MSKDERKQMAFVIKILFILLINGEITDLDIRALESILYEYPEVVADDFFCVDWIRNFLEWENGKEEGEMQCPMHTVIMIFLLNVALLDQEEKRYKKYRYQRVKKCKEITDRIEQLENEDEKDVLMYRYIKLMKWENICVKMKYSWRQIHQIHGRALISFKLN